MSDRGAQKREHPEPQQKKRIARVRVREISLKGTPPFGVIEIDRDTQVVTVRQHRKRSAFSYPLVELCAAIIRSGVMHKPGDVPEFGEDEDDGESEDT